MTAVAPNPLLTEWETPHGAPPFDAIRPEHFRPAFEAVMADHLDAIDTIAANPAAPTFDNTLVALERPGLALSRVAHIFFGLTGADTNEALQAIERDMAPLFARHSDTIHLNQALFERIRKVWTGDQTGLNDEQRRLLDRYHTNFTRSGAGLDEDGRRRLADINERLATFGTLFSQNVLADESAWTMELKSEADLAGLPDWARAAAAQAATDRCLEDVSVVTLARSSVETFLQFSTQRDLRETAFAAWTNRGANDNAHDNGALIAEIVALRNQRAELLGYDSHADYTLDDAMAKTPQAVADLLRTVWEPGVRLATRESADLQALVADDGGNHNIAAADWRFYSDRLRKKRFDFDESELKPYLQLDRMIDAAFWVAERLFGVSFASVDTVPTYHPDVRSWAASDRDGRFIGVFMADYFARPSKRGGAWMSNFRSQHRLDRDVQPIIVNVMNFSRPPDGEPALLSIDDARTLFHEFGHALHGLLSDVTYPLLSGTHVATDFVELPSQLYEHWLLQTEVLERFAVHYETGEAIPSALVEKVLAARTYNQGFATVEYTASALLDLDLHRGGLDGLDAAAFEARALESIGMPEAIVMRHRLPHFLHIFADDQYASGYYSYLWSEVLDADAFAAFEEAGDPFDPEVAARLHDSIYSAGNRRDPAEAYRLFRGRMPTADALLKKRGLDAAVS
ncbi:MAG: M3 family metallopeptidase [Hyphomicrobiales bacterium]|nr:M3 family metallopeptidase [Hyphomicrobiales bacterium]